MGGFWTEKNIRDELEHCDGRGLVASSLVCPASCAPSCGGFRLANGRDLYR